VAPCRRLGRKPRGHGGDPNRARRAELYQLAGSGTDGGFWDCTGLLTETVKRAERAHQLTGISTGLTDLDELLGGLHQSDLNVLAARPGMGKTAVATNIAFQAANGYRTEEQDGRKVTVDGGRWASLTRDVGQAAGDAHPR
jgi:replicative DNA helicase